MTEFNGIKETTFGFGQGGCNPRINPIKKFCLKILYSIIPIWRTPTI